MSRRALPAHSTPRSIGCSILKYWVIGTTVALFIAALVGMQFVQQHVLPELRPSRIAC